MSEGKFALRIVALAGFQNSGKSHVLKRLINKMLITGWQEKAVRNYEGTVFPSDEDRENSDFISLLIKDEKCVVVVTGGDYKSTPAAVLSIIVELEVSLSVKVDLAIVAARIFNQNILSQYEKICEEQHIAISTIHKIGFARTTEVDESVLAEAEGFWVDKLMAEVK